MRWEDDPFLRALKETALSLAPDLPGEVFSADPAVQDRWLRDNGFRPPDRGEGLTAESDHDG